MGLISSLAYAGPRIGQTVWDALIGKLHRAVAITPQDYGAVADGVTDDSAAFVAAIAYLNSIAVNDNSLNRASRRLLIPAGDYYLGTTTLDIHHTLIIEGEGTGLGGYASKLRWAAGATGIRIQRYNTTGANDTLSPTSRGGDGTIIRGLYLRGAFSTEGEYHGVHMRARAVVEDCVIFGFQGDGINITAEAGGGSIEGNANCAVVHRCQAYQNRNGLFIDGADANSVNIIACDFSTNHRWGVWDSSFLGNCYTGVHTSGNGWDGAAGYTPTACTYLGNRYAVIPGQETWCKTNAPSGTSANNQGWLYLGAGGTYSGVVAWVSGTDFVAGGGYYIDGGGGNQTNALINCYSEGDQNPTFAAGGTTFIEGTQPRGIWGLDGNPWCGWLFSNGTAMNANRHFAVGEDLTVGGTAIVDGLLKGANVRAQGGIMLSDGGYYDVNGVQVLGAQQTGCPAAATDLATAITLVNFLRTKGLAHGFIAS